MPAPALPPRLAEYIEELASKSDGALIAVFDRDGHYLYASPNHERVLGYTAEELLDMHLSQVVERSQHHAAWVLRTTSVFYPGAIQFSSRLVAKSGGLVGVSGTLQHFPGGYFVTCVKPE